MRRKTQAAMLLLGCLAGIPGGAEISTRARAAAPTIEDFVATPDSPLPGEAVELRARVRNTSDEPLEGATLRFHQDSRPLGAPVLLDPLPAGGSADVVLTVRPSGIGRFSFTGSLAAAGLAPSIRATGFDIRALPAWWSRLDGALAAADPGPPPGPRSAMTALSGHPACATDLRASHALQRHGTAILAGLREVGRDPAAAERHFADALAALSDIAGALYCVDLDDLAAWDRALAGFWRSMQARPEPDLSFEAAVVATWNPALLVLDAMQFTGTSEIVAAYRDLAPDIDRALARYPVDSYGAAWLDAFGTGQLYRHGGAEAAARLREVLAKPALLGLGTCPLTAHAGKAAPDLPCLEGIARVTRNCTATGTAEILAGLSEAGMLAPLLFGNFAAEAGRRGLPPGSAVSVDGDAVGTFGTPLAASIPGLCAALASAAQPRGLQDMAGSFGGTDFAALGGCALALVEAGTGGPDPAGRVLQCIAARGGPSAAAGLPAATQIRFPSACARADTLGGDAFHDLGRRLYYRQTGDPGATSVYSKTDSLRAPFSSERDVTFSDGSREVIGEVRAEGVLGPLTQGSHRIEDAGGGTVFEGSYDYDPITGALVRSVETETRADGSTRQTYREQGSDGRMRTTVTEKDPDGNTVSVRTSPPATTRPADPEGGGCPETAAQARAMATFDCLFVEGLEVLDPLGGIAPRIRPLGGATPLPQACDQVDPAAFWNSGHGATDPVPWEVSGGPAVFESFVPRVDGVIDPPRDWVGIPRRPGAPD